MFFCNQNVSTEVTQRQAAKQEDQVQGGEEIDGSQKQQKFGSSESQIEICKYTKFL